MSRPRYWWRAVVEKVIRNYPDLRARKNAKQGQSVTASYSGMPRGGGAGRNTESAALRCLSPREEADLRAVEKAIEEVGRQELGGEVLRVVELYQWKGVRNFETIGEMLHMGRNTAKRRNERFLYAVAKNMGYHGKLG